jgi:hypothetical protein
MQRSHSRSFGIRHNFYGTESFCFYVFAKSVVFPTDRQKLEAQKTCDIIHHGSFASGADFCQ